MADETLRQRAETWAAANCDCNTSALAVFARAELLRAAEIAATYKGGFYGGGTGGDWTCMEKIAAAIRKLAE